MPAAEAVRGGSNGRSSGGSWSGSGGSALTNLLALSLLRVAVAEATRGAGSWSGGNTRPGHAV